jgi:hypothetical protein
VSTPRAGASCFHFEGVVLRPLGLRLLERLPASLDAMCMAVCGARAPEALCSAAGDVEQPAIICGDCGMVHPTRDTVKQVKGSLVCKGKGFVLVVGTKGATKLQPCK